MSNEQRNYTIYTFEFHQAPSPSIIAKADKVDGAKYLKQAQKCFNSLFDEHHVDGLIKTNGKGESDRLPNDILHTSNDIYIWRINNNQLKAYWEQNGKDTKGIDKYEEKQVISHPYSYVLIDNRPGRGLMAIEKSSVWGNADKLCDVIRKNLNTRLADKFDLEMHLAPRMDSADFWDFIHHRIYDCNDRIQKITFSFHNPKKINNSRIANVKSRRLKALAETVQISGALEAMLSMKFTKTSEANITKKNRDIAEVVQYCCDNGYKLSVKFKDYKVYRANEQVRTCFPLSDQVLEGFRIDTHLLNDKTELEEWFDNVFNSH